MLDLDFGKYAPFVWTAFGLTFAVFAFMIVSALAHARRWKRKAEELSRR